MAVEIELITVAGRLKNEATTATLNTVPAISASTIDVQ